MRHTIILRYLLYLLIGFTVALAMTQQSVAFMKAQINPIDAGRTGSAATPSECSLDTASFSPLQSPWFGLNVIDIEPDQITPSHVFMHTKRLQQYANLLGLDSDNLSLSLYHADIAPRHNFQLAYDLFVLLQLWQQQQGRLRAPIQQVFPDTVEPQHVYQWIDASLALLWCFSDTQKLYTPDMFDVAPVSQLTPADEMVLLVEVMQQVAAEIPDSQLESLLFMRLTQMQYLLQDMLLPTADRSIVKWRSDNDDRTLSAIFGNIVSHFEALNLLALPVRRIQESINEDNQRFVFLLVAGQLFGELLHLNQHHFNLSIPPMISVVALPTNADSLLSDAVDVDRLLRSLIADLEDKT